MDYIVPRGNKKISLFLVAVYVVNSNIEEKVHFAYFHHDNSTSNFDH